MVERLTLESREVSNTLNSTVGQKHKFRFIIDRLTNNRWSAQIKVKHEHQTFDAQRSDDLWRTDDNVPGSARKRDNLYKDPAYIIIKKWPLLSLYTHYVQYVHPVLTVSTYWLVERRVSIRLRPNDELSVGSTRPARAPSHQIGSLDSPRAPQAVPK